MSGSSNDTSGDLLADRRYAWAMAAAMAARRLAAMRDALLRARLRMATFFAP